MTNILENLNSEQLSAVSHEKGPLLIVAGAGTGKTTVITRRIAWLIMEKGVKPDEILALTFTNKAAQEMSERVDKLLPYGYVDLWVSTFHTFCQRILEAHALDIGLPSGVELLDQTGQWLLMREHLRKFALDYYRPSHNPTKFIHALLQHFSKLKDEEITPEKYLEYAEELKLSQDDVEASGGKSARTTPNPSSERRGQDTSPDEIKRIVEVANAYHVYQQLLLGNDKMDFGDLINYVLKLFRERPSILKKYQTQFKYILVDEFQDTNWAQYDLVKMLALPRNNLTVVADDDQSIYRFRGASMSNVIQFSREFKDAAKVALVRNYRSGQQILDLSYNFIQLNNPNRLEASQDFGVNKKLLAEAKDAASVEHLHCQSGNDEARIVAETILALKKADKLATWNDFAILVRANNQAQEFEQALQIAGIPSRNSSAAGLYKTRIIADILALFDALVDYNDGRAIFRLLNLPWLDIAMEDIIKMTHWADRKRIALYSVLLQPQVAGVANEVSLAGLARLRSALEGAQAALSKDRPTQILHKWLLDKGGYVDHLKNLPDADNLDQFRNLRAFWEHLLQIEKGLGDCRVKDVLAVIKQELQSGDEGDLPPDLESGPEMVKLMTIHSAKGLEFNYVFATNLVDRRFPTVERRDAISIPDALVKEIVPTGDAHLEEERRLFYVAMTRAKRGLFLTSADNYGGVTKKKLSRFLVELSQTTPTFKTSIQPLMVRPSDFFVPLRHQPSPRLWPTRGYGGQVKKANEFKLPIPNKFSFTQLRIYAEDPLSYKLQFIYKVPTLGKDVFSYGSTIHAALQKFFYLLSERSRSAQTDLFGGPPPNPRSSRTGGGTEAGRVLPVSLNELLAIYEESWIDDWYNDENSKKKMHAQGRERLKQFYEHLVASGAVPNIKALERPFNIRIGDYTIAGRIDRIDQLADGSVRIVDYKTGKLKHKLEDNDKKQLLIYQIVVEEVFKEKVSELVYHYIDAENIKSGENQIAFLGSPAEKEETKAWVIEQIKGIESGNFPINDEAPFPSPEVEYLRDLAEIGVL